MTATVEAALADQRETLIAALHDELRDVLDVARITAIVDLAVDRTGLAIALEGIAAADAAVTALSAQVPTPNPATVAAVGAYQAQGSQVNNHYGQEFVSDP